jgi:2-polyprenyl-3-methyl-5-hydroxy-6-metoxy-1,4-benzoquinol methylase
MLLRSNAIPGRARPAARANPEPRDSEPLGCALRLVGGKLFSYFSRMTKDPHRPVRAGYDDVADVYLERFGASAVRQNWLDCLIDGLPASGGRVLDLGCGAGIPVARDLAALDHAVVGVDGSAQLIVRARRNVPAEAHPGMTARVAL